MDVKHCVSKINNSKIWNKVFKNKIESSEVIHTRISAKQYIVNYTFSTDDKINVSLVKDETDLIIKGILSEANLPNKFILTPFYENALLDKQVKFDCYAFKFDVEESSRAYKVNRKKELLKISDGNYGYNNKLYSQLDNSEKSRQDILRPQVPKTLDEFGKLTEKYLDLLKNELTVEMFREVNHSLNITSDDVKAFGYFKMEIICK